MKKIILISFLIILPLFGQVNVSPIKMVIGAHCLSSDTTTTCTIADTYYKILGTWSDENNYLFEIDGAGKITYIGSRDVTVLFNGVSDLQVSVASLIHYGLYINGALVTGAETPHDFTASSKIDGVAITAFILLSYGDYIEVYVKSDNAGTVVTHNTLFLTFYGE